MFESTTDDKRRLSMSKYADHDYFVIKGTTDVDKMRQEAVRRAEGDFYTDPGSSIIHHHRFNEDCTYKLQDDKQTHERFGPQHE